MTGVKPFVAFRSAKGRAFHAGLSALHTALPETKSSPCLGASRRAANDLIGVLSAVGKSDFV